QYRGRPCEREGGSRQHYGDGANGGELPHGLAFGRDATDGVEPELRGRANGAEPRNGEGWPGREGKRVQRRRSGACDFRRRGLFRVDNSSRKSNEKQIVNL